MTSAAKHPDASTGRSSVIESHAIDYIPTSERRGKAWHQGPFWFASNFVLVVLVPGFTGPAMGLSLGWSLVAIVGGVAFGTIFAACHANQGPRLGLPQLIQSRAQFGSRGAVLPFAAALFVYIGFTVFNIIIAAHALSTIIDAPAWLMYVVLSAIAGTAAVVGHDLLHRLQRWMAYGLIPIIAVFTVYALTNVRPASLPAGGVEPGFDGVAFLAQFAVGAALQISLAVFISDYTRYLPSNVSARSIVGWTFGGMGLSAIWLMSLGAFLASSFADPDPIYTVRDVGDGLFPGFGVIVVVIATPALISLSAVEMYGGALTGLSMLDAFKRVERAKWQRVTGVVLIAVLTASLAVVLPENYLHSFETFLALLLTFLVPWTAINLTDFYVIRRGRYSSLDIVDPDGPYGHWSRPGLIAYALSIAAMLPFLSIGSHTAPLAYLLGGVDISFVVGLIVGSAAYLLLARGNATAAPALRRVRRAEVSSQPRLP